MVDPPNADRYPVPPLQVTSLLGVPIPTDMTEAVLANVVTENKKLQVPPLRQESAARGAPRGCVCLGTWSPASERWLRVDCRFVGQSAD